MKITRYLALGCFVCGLSVVAGCGIEPSRGVELHPVSGTVLLNGEPLSGATVSFYPTDPQLLASKVPIAKGTTDESGSYELRTFEPGDGARAGEYAVTVRKIETVDDGGPLEERDQLLGKHANYAEPAATVNVKSGSNQLDPIELD